MPLLWLLVSNMWFSHVRWTWAARSCESLWGALTVAIIRSPSWRPRCQSRCCVQVFLKELVSLAGKPSGRSHRLLGLGFVQKQVEGRNIPNILQNALCHLASRWLSSSPLCVCEWPWARDTASLYGQEPRRLTLSARYMSHIYREQNMHADCMVHRHTKICNSCMHAVGPRQFRNYFSSPDLLSSFRCMAVVYIYMYIYICMYVCIDTQNITTPFWWEVGAVCVWLKIISRWLENTVHVWWLPCFLRVKAGALYYSSMADHAEVKSFSKRTRVQLQLIQSCCRSWPGSHKLCAWL